MTTEQKLLRPFTKTEIANLRNLIIGSQLAAENIRRNKIETQTGVARWSARLKKKNFGYQTRHFLLVYGFLRGKLYREIEPRKPKRITSTGWVPASDQVDIKYLFLLCQIFAPSITISKYASQKVSEADILAWIAEDKKVFLTKKEWVAQLPKVRIS